MNDSKIRFGQATLTASALLVTVSCGATSPSTVRSLSPVPDISTVNPCSLITKEELQQWGITSQSKPVSALGETGCQWDGTPRSIVLTKANDGLDFFDKKASTLINYVKNTVNGRPAVQFQISHTNTECSEVMAVGSGYVSVDMDYGVPDHAGPNYRFPTDPCGEAMAIAKVIEPRLPK